MFVELYRRHKDNIFFLQNGSETDFLIHKQAPEIIQVCHTITPANRNREVSWCLYAMKKFAQSHAIIITAEQEDTMLVDKTIDVIPFYKWISLSYDHQ